MNEESTKKLKVAILYGGPSNEHEVSISSAKNVIENIDTSKFDVVELFIPKDSEFNINDVIETECDIVYPVLHGTFGEDGTLQELLERAGIPFVGSGSVSSGIAIDKNASNKLFAENDLCIPKGQIITKDNPKISIDFPIIIKPVNEGSSIGLFKCNSLAEYEEMQEDIFSIYKDMLAQEFILGREFTCGVIEIDGKVVALPVSEIIVDSTKIFDYKAKYTLGECLEITPADIEVNAAAKIQDIALRCHVLLDCKSISRTDFILTESNKIYVLETNTLPGMTKTSFIPAEAEAYGLSMKELINCLLESAT
jgi:D-alanine-D-alanine ligase